MTEASPGEKLAGRRVLVVEDEAVLAMLVESALQDLGATVLGPCARVAEALQMAGHEALDIALLDVNLAGERVFPVAEMLDRRGVPFLLLSGYGQDAVPRDRTHWHALSKPFKMADVVARLSGLLKMA